ncbi:hypothetical protein NDU88_004264 [Pleurodeles waltl]|uniref:Uncharacterized protein n=1 Tax=Pleurodeles waltl TaxID=8319 RepID=A0AAV7QHB1_PLEWA|nr:hypothetical protein NDU88_004264 [Pleurodeles waltl]
MRSPARHRQSPSTLREMVSRAPLAALASPAAALVSHLAARCNRSLDGGSGLRGLQRQRQLAIFKSSPSACLLCRAGTHHCCVSPVALPPPSAWAVARDNNEKSITGWCLGPRGDPSWVALGPVGDT